jgi:hypothetical protein
MNGSKTIRVKISTERLVRTISSRCVLTIFGTWACLFEAFTADALDWWVENTARRWATGCDFPAVSDKRVVLEEFPIRNVGVMQAVCLQYSTRQIQGSEIASRVQFCPQF